jgi:protein-lysine N-methyltransferase EEF2KMT
MSVTIDDTISLHSLFSQSSMTWRLSSNHYYQHQRTPTIISTSTDTNKIPLQLQAHCIVCEISIVVVPIVQREDKANSRKCRAKQLQLTARLSLFTAGHLRAAGQPPCCTVLKLEWLIQRGDAVARPYRHELITGTPPADDDAVVSSGRSATADVSCWRRELLSLEDRLREAAQFLVSSNVQDDDKPLVIFCKHMAKHCFLYNFDKEVLADDLNVHFEHKHLLLIRDPVQVLSSWGAVGNAHGNVATPDEVGIVPLLSIYSTVESRLAYEKGRGDDGKKVKETIILLDSDELAANPQVALANVCSDLGIDYKESMMSWKAGPHACDGPWEAWWYSDVHQSTGWNVKTTPDYGSGRYRTLNPKLLPALDASFPAYQFLMRQTRAYRERRRPQPDKKSCEAPKKESHYEDPRNAHLLVWIGAPGGRGGRLMPREMASVSPWDSSVQGGDAAWEGLRVYRGKILSLEKHLKRLFHSAKALGFENVHTKEEIIEAIFRTLAANGMRDGAHMRLTLTRGEKCTSSMNPQFNVYGTTLIILPEWKPTIGGATTYDNTAGISLITACQRRNPPQTGVDSKIHHNNLINNILPKISANLAGCADAIMLDVEGYVAETNATNIFLVDDDGVLMTPTGDHCLPGITRETVLELANELGIKTCVRRLSLAEFYFAAEVFTTGTMGELTPVNMIDGRVIGPPSIDGSGGTSSFPGPVTTKLQQVYATLPERPGWATELPPFEDAE